MKIRRTEGHGVQRDQAWRVLGMASKLSTDLQQIFVRSAKVPITDLQLRKLIQMAVAPNKEVLKNLQAGHDDELSTCFRNLCNSVAEYAFTSPSQQLDTTRGTLFGAYNAITGYFQNVGTYKDPEAKLRSILLGGTAQLRTQAAFRLCEGFDKGGPSTLHFN